MLKLHDWHYTDVPGLDTVIFSPEVMQGFRRAQIDGDELRTVLAFGKDVRARTDHTVIGREYKGVRLIFRTWPGLEGAAAVCVNGYRVAT
jgi:hypothetical protein